MAEDKTRESWRDGVFLCTVRDSFEADLFESKLRGEGIPCLKKYKGASNFMEIFMGSNTAYPIELYVPEEFLEDAKNIVVAVPLGDDWDEEAEFESE